MTVRRKEDRRESVTTYLDWAWREGKNADPRIWSDSSEGKEPLGAFPFKPFCPLPVADQGMAGHAGPKVQFPPLKVPVPSHSTLSTTLSLGLIMATWYCKAYARAKRHNTGYRRNQSSFGLSHSETSLLAGQFSKAPIAPLTGRDR